MTATLTPSSTATAARDRTAFKVWRMCAWSGALYATVGLVFWAIIAGYMPAPHESLHGQGIKDFFGDHETRIRVGMVGYIAIAAFYLPWSVVIARIMQRIEGPYGVLNRIEFFGGIATTFVTLFSGVMWLTASFRTPMRTAGEVQLLSDVGWFIFDCTFMVTSLQYVALGTAILMDKQEKPYLPPWLAWLSFLTAASFLPLVAMPFFTSGPLAWHGLLNYWVALGLFFVLIYSLTYFLLGAIRRIEAEELGD
ncbi:MAG: hypothetical protein ACJ72E_16640 [Marmoricola sp.]